MDGRAPPRAAPLIHRTEMADVRALMRPRCLRVNRRCHEAEPSLSAQAGVAVLTDRSAGTMIAVNYGRPGITQSKFGAGREAGISALYARGSSQLRRQGGTPGLRRLWRARLRRQPELIVERRSPSKSPQGRPGSDRRLQRSSTRHLDPPAFAGRGKAPQGVASTADLPAGAMSVRKKRG